MAEKKRAATTNPSSPDYSPRSSHLPGRPRIEIFCKRCGVSIGWGHRQNYCGACLQDISEEHARQMQAKAGPYYEHWKRRRREGMIRELVESGSTEGLLEGGRR